MINKIDTVDHDAVFGVIEAYRKLYDFAEIVPLSALRGKNCNVLLDQIFKYLPYGPAYYDEDVVTDQPQRQIVMRSSVRRRSMHFPRRCHTVSRFPSIR